MTTLVRLLQFPSKASPTPADIVYLGNAADAFNEVQSTIAEVIAAYPILSNIAGLTLNNGQLIIGVTNAAPAAATLTAGANIAITNGSGTITIAATGAGGFAWAHVTGTSQIMSSNNGYVVDNSGLVTLSLPAASVLGDEIEIIGRGAGGWSISQGASQQIIFGSSSSTAGAGGSLSSSNRRDSVYLVCTAANLEWTVAAVQGILTVV